MGDHNLSGVDEMQNFPTLLCLFHNLLANNMHCDKSCAVQDQE